MKKVSALALAGLLGFGAVANADIDNLDFGGDLMMEYFVSNNIDRDDAVSDNTDFFRSEGHVWLQADLDDNITARISLEFDRAFNQAGVPFGNSTNNLAVTGSDDLDVFLEEAFLKVANVWGSNVSVAAGRMFLNYGDNQNADDFNGWWGPSFILGDSRSNEPLVLSQIGSYEIDPFDALVASYQGEQHQIDVVYYQDVEDTIGLYGNGGRPDSDAYGLLLYASFFGIEGHQIDLYYNYNEQNFDNIAAGQLGFDGDQHTFGARAAGDLSDALAYKLEVAYQLQDAERAGVAEADALAAQAGINYHPDSDYNPNIGLIYTYLSEDNGSGFASPYEAKTYGQLAEGIVKLAGGGVFTNMNVFNLNGGLEFSENVAGTLDLYYFLLDDDVVTPSGGTDDEGGIEIDAQIDYRFNDNLTTFLGGGVLFAGDALEGAGGSDDEAYFIRTGLKVAF